MNKQKFEQILNSEELLSEEDLKNLDTLKEDYPFSQMLYTLAAINSYKRKTGDAKKKLNKAAVYATDRTILKEAILATESSKPLKPQQKSSDPSAKEAVKEKVPVTDTRKSESEKTQSERTTKETVVEDTSGHPGHLTAREAEELRNEVIKNLEDLKIIKNNFMKSLEEDDKKPGPKAKKKQKKKVKAGKETKKVKEAKEAKEVKPIKSTKTAKTAKATKTTKTTKPKQSNQKKAPAKVPKTKKTEDKKTTSSTPKASTGRSKVSQSDKKVNQREQNEIIERFIKEEPSISKVKSKKDKVQDDLSEQSVEFGEDLVSENLAKIMIKQGKKGKAVEIYKKLIWKYPQKKAYFASQIESLKER